MRYISSWLSPTARPPTAYPGKSSFEICFACSTRISSYTPPWFIPNNNCCLLIVSGNEFNLSISSLHRFNQRVVRATEFSIYLRSATLDGHSSNAIAIVDARFDWICILCSGPMKILRPSI